MRSLSKSLAVINNAVLISEVLKKQSTILELDSLSMLLSDKHHGVYRFASGDYDGEVLSKGFQLLNSLDDDVKIVKEAKGPMVGILGKLGLKTTCSRTVHRPPNPSVGKGKQRNY